MRTYCEGSNVVAVAIIPETTSRELAAQDYGGASLKCHCSGNDD